MKRFPVKVSQLIIISVLLIFMNGCMGIGWKVITTLSPIVTGYIKHKSDKVRDIAITKDLDRIMKELEQR